MPTDKQSLMAKYEAFITANWQAHGLGQVLVVRYRDAAVADIAGFVVDVWCLGVKDAFANTDFPVADLADLYAGLFRGDREAIDPHCARKFIENAVNYAERLGFAPHRDYRKARRVLSGLDADRCTTEFTFGRDGRPYYQQGSESDEAAERVVSRLKAVVGEDGFDFALAPEIDLDVGDEEIAEARENLLDFLAAEPPSVPRFHALSGMITAALLAPESVPPMQIMDLLWDPDEKTWDSQEELQNFITSLTTYWNFLAATVMDACSDDADEDVGIVDVWDEDCPDGFDPDKYYVGAMIEWAGGFMRCLEAWPDKWGNVPQRPELVEPLSLIRAYAEFAVAENREKISSAMASGYSLDEAAIAIGRAARPELR